MQGLHVNGLIQKLTTTVLCSLGNITICFAGGEEITNSAGTADMTTAAIKMIGSLLFIVGLILFIFYVLRKVKLRGFPLSKSTPMKVIGTLNIAPRKSVTMIEVCGQWLVLGVGAESITLLEKINEQRINKYLGGSGQKSQSAFHGIMSKHMAEAEGPNQEGK